MRDQDIGGKVGWVHNRRYLDLHRRLAGAIVETAH